MSALLFEVVILDKMNFEGLKLNFWYRNWVEFFEN